MSRIDSWIQRHPVAWGEMWAAATLAGICLFNYARGGHPPNLLIYVPIWAVAGIVFGYSVKWTIDRKELGR